MLFKTNANQGANEYYLHVETIRNFVSQSNHTIIRHVKQICPGIRLIWRRPHKMTFRLIQVFSV